MREVRASARIRAIAMARAASACLLMIAACAKPVPLMPPGYLQIDIPTAPSAIDPRFAADAISARVAELIYDSLVRMDRDETFLATLPIASNILRRTKSSSTFGATFASATADRSPRAT
jgi:ABC-type oligopeptide transport system substrate-binding subunit